MSATFTPGPWARLPVGLFRDRRYRQLSMEAKALLPWLAAGPRSGMGRSICPLLGLVEIEPEEIAFHLGMEMASVEAALVELEATGAIVADRDHGYIAVPVAVCAGAATNAKALAGLLRTVGHLPTESLAVQAFLTAVVESILSVIPRWTEAEQQAGHRLLAELAAAFPSVKALALDTLSIPYAEPIDTVPIPSISRGRGRGEVEERKGQGEDEGKGRAREGETVSKAFGEASPMRFFGEMMATLEEGPAQSFATHLQPREGGNGILHLDAHPMYYAHAMKHTEQLNRCAHAAGYTRGVKIHERKH